MARLNITVPDELYERLERWRDHVNLSRVCQEALARELDKLEELPAELHRMQQALSRLGQEKAKVDRACFRKGVYDGLEWARQAEYPALKQWGEQAADGDALHTVLRGPAAKSATVHTGDPAWEPLPYAEGWIAGVRQFWDRAKKHL
jgi:hypothetical protein